VASTTLMFEKLIEIEVTLDNILHRYYHDM
jgi:hypothetical protein